MAGKTKKQRRNAQTVREVAGQNTPDAAQTHLPAAQMALSAMTAWVCLALIGLNLFVFAAIRHNDFINYDDPQYVTENPNIAHGLTGQALSWALSSGYAFNWHPLTWVSHMLDIEWFGLNPGPHHLTSLVLHILNSILLFVLLLWITGAAGRSAFVAALFAAHPLHVESVAWVAERKDVLSTFFLILTLWAYAAYVRRPGTGRYFAMLALFGLGLMAKPMLVTLPFLLLLLDVWPLRRISLTAAPGWRQAVVEKVPLFALAAASSVVTFIAQRQGGAVAGLAALPLKFRLENALVSYAAYIGTMLWPVRLAPFYPYSALSAWLVGLSGLGLIVVSALVIRGARRFPYLPVGWFWYLGTLVPVIGIIQVGDQSRADRYTYVPLIGLFLIVAWGVHDLTARWPYPKVVRAAAGGLAITLCAITARSQAERWKNNVTIWEHTLAVTSDNALAHSNLAIAFWEQGNIPGAISHYTEALRIKPNVASDHGNLGVALAGQGDTDGAIRELQEAVRLKPSEATYQYNLGLMFLRSGKTAEAQRHFEAAIAIQPQYEDARRMLDSLTGHSQP